MATTGMDTSMPPAGEHGGRWGEARQRAADYLVAAGLTRDAADAEAGLLVARLAALQPAASGDDAVLLALRTVRDELERGAGAGTGQLGPLAPSPTPQAIRRQSLLPALRWRRGRWLPRPVLILGESRDTGEAARPPYSMLDILGGQRRTAFILLILVTAAWAVSTFAEVLATNGLSVLDIVHLAVFSVLILWLAQSFWTLTAGAGVVLARLLRAKPASTARPDAADLAGRVALVMPVYNEETERVFAGLKAMWLDLRRAAPDDRRFDLLVLSDTTDPDIWLAEIEAWRRLRHEVGDEGRIFYRRRTRNVGRKTGNIEDFLTSFGGNYAYMLVLDADSLMTGRTMLELARRMDENPSVGLIQVPPKLVRGRSLFARVLQFSGELYGPLAAAGTGFWARGEGNYWGHNAIIRVRPFMELCGLPHLSGPAPFGGPILSHDFVEAALMRRGGWQVWIADDLGGSYEEPPPTIEDFAVRDRRWCQGNLQHIRVLFARRLHWVSRLHLGIGIMSYLTSPLWLVFLALSAMQAWELAHDQPLYFTDGWPFPVLPVSVSAEATLLLVITLGLLFMPKLMGLALALIDPPRRRALGGGLRVVGSALLETLYSGLIAPISMLLHTSFVTSILLGGAIEWKPQRRDATAGRLDVALRAFLWPTLLGLAATIGTWIFTPHLFFWLLPVTAGLVLAVPLAVAGASAALGDRLQRLGLLVIAEEALPPAIMWELDHGSAPHPAASSTDRLTRAVLEPQANGLHVQLLRALQGPQPGPIGEDRWLTERKAVYLGPSSLSKAERRVILEDPELMERLHLQAWLHWPGYLPGILGALKTGVASTSPAPPTEPNGRRSAVAA